MPLYWTIDSREHLFSVRAEGTVDFADVLSFLEAVSGACAFTYRKLFDGRAGNWVPTDEEILSVCAETRSFHQRDRMGALALVLTSKQTWQLARLLGVLAVADRPMKVFETARQARRWIDLQIDRPADSVSPLLANV